jgi:ketosteroid isomerase-like protein
MTANATTPSGNHAQALETAERFTRAFPSQDFPEISELWADEIVVWHSFDQIAQNKADSLAAIKASFAVLEKIEYRDVRRAITATGFVQQHLLTIVRRADSATFNSPVCVVADVSRGRIVRLDEYMDRSLIAAIASASPVS